MIEHISIVRSMTLLFTKETDSALHFQYLRPKHTLTHDRYRECFTRTKKCLCENENK